MYLVSQSRHFTSLHLLASRLRVDVALRFRLSWTERAPLSRPRTPHPDPPTAPPPTNTTTTSLYSKNNRGETDGASVPLTWWRSTVHLDLDWVNAVFLARTFTVASWSGAQLPMFTGYCSAADYPLDSYEWRAVGKVAILPYFVKQLKKQKKN